MDIAIYYHAGHKKNIVANDYDGWPEEQRNSMNPHLQCPACRAPVHFRRKSRDGKDPCFVAQHEYGCPMASSSHYIAAVAAAAIREVEQIIKDTSVLELNLNLPDRNPPPAGFPTRIVDDPEGKLNEVYASAGTPSSLDPGLQTLQAYSLDILRKDNWI